MGLGLRTVRGHICGPSDLRDEKGRVLYGISEMKAPDEPPFLYNQKECVAYIHAHEKPFDKMNRVDAYGMVRKRKVDLYCTREKLIVEDKEGKNFDEVGQSVFRKRSV